jgi:hypothetical protein
MRQKIEGLSTPTLLFFVIKIRENNMRKVTLVLEYELGEFEDDLVSNDPKDLEDYFFQSDVFIHDMEIVAVKIKKVEG